MFPHLPLYLAAHIWLSGSLLLPCMLLVRWGAVKRKGLHLLAKSRSRWILAWGCFGFVGVAAVAALLWMKNFELPPFDSLGWAWMIISSVQYPFHIHTSYIAAQFLFGLVLKATGEAAIDCGLAATAWWVYGVLTQESKARRTIEKYGICFMVSACVLGAVNNSYFWRSPCADCFAPHGVPFTWFHEGGFAGGEGFVWTGVIENSVVVLVLALVLGLAWNKVTRQHKRAQITQMLQ